MNLAWNVTAYRAGTHPDYEPTAKDGIFQTLEVLDAKRIKVVVNGGALNPKGLAEEVAAKVETPAYDSVATLDD